MLTLIDDFGSDLDDLIITLSHYRNAVINGISEDEEISCLISDFEAAKKSFYSLIGESSGGNSCSVQEVENEDKMG